MATPLANTYLLLRDDERQMLNAAIKIQEMVRQVETRLTGTVLARYLWQKSDGRAFPDLFERVVDVFLERKVVSLAAADAAIEAVREIMREFIDTRVDVD